MRSRWVVGLGLVVLLGATITAIVVTVANHRTPPAPACVASADGFSYVLDEAQAVDAATITAVAAQAGLPHHAVTVALAAALQESKLENLPYGDRDSVGIFQQRPSQGWGPKHKLLEPAYAAGAFFDRLRQVPGWESRTVADAAQQVQHSAAGSAYAQWETQARTMARVLTGEVPAGLSCSFTDPARTTPAAVASAFAAQLEPTALTAPLPQQRAWSAAAWLVANAHRLGIRAVSVRGRMWRNTWGQWRPDPTTSMRIRIERFPRQ